MKFICLFLFAFAMLFSTNQISVSNITSNIADSTENCLVCSDKIEGQGVKYKYLNKEVTFCHDGCEKSFKKNPAKFLKSAGLRCPVCDEDDAKKELSSVSGGTKYYFCSKGCKTKFGKDPEAELKKYK